MEEGWEVGHPKHSALEYLYSLVALTTKPGLDGEITEAQFSTEKPAANSNQLAHKKSMLFSEDITVLKGPDIFSAVGVE